MIEFGGAVPLAPDAVAAGHLLTLIAAASERVIFDIGTDLLSGPSGGSVLQDNPSNTEDGWIFAVAFNRLVRRCRRRHDRSSRR